MKKKNLSLKAAIIPALVMLLVSVIALSSATYAWFTMSTDVNVSGIQMTAQAPSSVEIAFGHAPADTDWTSSLVLNNSYRLKPASTTNGINFCYANGNVLATSSLNYAFGDPDSKFTLDETDAPFSIVTRQTEARNTTGETFLENTNVNSTVTGSYYYVDIPVSFRTVNKTSPVSLTLLVTADDVDADNNNLEKALRVAIVQSNLTDVKIASTPGADNIIENNALLLTTEDDSDPLTDDTKVERATVAYNLVTMDTTDTTKAANSCATFLTIPAGVANQPSSSVKVFIRVWLEGEDKSCLNSYVNQTMKLNLRFLEKAGSGVQTP